MPVINFDSKFAYLVKIGLKRQTIRKERARPIKAGDSVKFLTGHRSANCDLLATHKIKSVASVKILEDRVYINSAEISDPQGLDMVAKLDGFHSFDEMRSFFVEKYGLPFDGVLLKW